VAERGVERNAFSVNPLAKQTFVSAKVFDFFLRAVYENLQMQERTYLRDSVNENLHYFRAQRTKNHKCIKFICEMAPTKIFINFASSLRKMANAEN
jgi:hypothetical protein